MNKDTFKSWLDIIQSIVVIAGVLIALYQLKLQNDTLQATKEIESGKFILEFSRNISDKKYAELTSAIEDNDENFHILKSNRGKFSDTTLEDYIGNFETIGELEKRKLIDRKMAYNEFSYSVEKAWCNKDVRSHINETRKQGSEFFINFENLARIFLKEDIVKDCKNLAS
jgi:hypothetical protein